MQLSEVEMKFLLVHFIVVPLIIFTMPSLKGMTADGASSCKELYDTGRITDSGNYTIELDNEEEKLLYCENSCDGEPGGWTRAVYINAYDPNGCRTWQLNYNVVPSSISEIPEMKYCTRSQMQTEKNGCISIQFPTFGIPYNKVCGKAKGYQLGFTRAFHSTKYAYQGLNGSYVSGLSVTRGEEREHIWTFAAGYSKAYGYATVNCPCAIYPGPDPPKLVGKNYFCESGNPDNVRRRRYTNDTLWDSDGCATGSKCCKRGGPWFKTELKTEKQESDYIEVRMCRYPRLYPMIEDIGVDELEIYIH